MSVNIKKYDVGNNMNIPIDKLCEEPSVISVDVKNLRWDSDLGLHDMVKDHLCDTSSTLNTHTLESDLNERLAYSKFGIRIGNLTHTELTLPQGE